MYIIMISHSAYNFHTKIIMIITGSFHSAALTYTYKDIHRLFTYLTELGVLRVQHQRF